MSELDNLTLALGGAMSEPSEHVIEQDSPANADDATTQQSAPGASIGAVDDHGNPFDPERHAVDADGNPKKTQAGRWAKKRGRKSGSESKSSIGGISDKSEQAAQAQNEAMYRATGQVAAQTLITIGMIVSDEFAPRVDSATGVNERVMLENAFTEYCRAKEVSDIPPGVALTIAIAGYIVPRLTQPKTQKRTEQMFNWFGQKWLKFKSWRGKRRMPKEEKADDGKDTKKEA